MLLLRTFYLPFFFPAVFSPLLRWANLSEKKVCLADCESCLVNLTKSFSLFSNSLIFSPFLFFFCGNHYFFLLRQQLGSLGKHAPPSLHRHHRTKKIKIFSASCTIRFSFSLYTYLMTFTSPPAHLELYFILFERACSSPAALNFTYRTPKRLQREVVSLSSSSNLCTSTNEGQFVFSIVECLDCASVYQSPSYLLLFIFPLSRWRCCCVIASKLFQFHFHNLNHSNTTYLHD